MFQYDTASPHLIELQAQEFLVQGSLVLRGAGFGGLDRIAVAVTITPSTSGGAAAASVAGVAEFAGTDRLGNHIPAPAQGATAHHHHHQQQQQQGQQGDGAAAFTAAAPQVPYSPDETVRVYAYQFWAAPGDRVSVVPNAPGQPLVFYPASADATVARKSCPVVMPTVQGACVLS